MAQSALRNLQKSLVPDFNRPLPSETMQPTYGMAENVDPSLRERMMMSIYDVLGGSISPSARARANSYSDIASNLVDWIPTVGEGVGASDAYTDFNRGNYGQAAIGGAATMLGVVPVAGDAAAKVVRTAGKAVRAAGAAEELAKRGIDMSQAARMQTESELAHEVAQRNAALPVEQGGLGLPPNNTAMDRAKAMGFDTPAYHGTNQDISAFDLSKAGTQMKKDWGDAAYLTPSQSNAEYYAIEAARSNNPELQAAYKKYDALASQPKQVINGAPQYPPGTNDALAAFRLAGKNADASPSGANVMPLLVDSSRAHKHMVGGGQTDPYLFLNERMAERGKDMAMIYDNPDKLSEIAVYDPSKVRSRFAAFDPFERNSSNIMAGVAGTALGLSALRNINKDSEQMP